MTRRARVLHWMLGVLILVTAVTLYSLFSRGRGDIAGTRSPAAAADEAPPARSSLPAAASRQRELQRLIAGHDEASKPWGVASPALPAG